MFKEITQFYNVQIPLKQDNLLVFYDTIDNCYKSIRLSSIYGDIYDEVMASCHIDSMAFESSSDYAVSTHDHDNYNYIDYVSYLSNQAGEYIATIKDSSGDRNFDLRLASISSNNQNDILEMLQPKIGQTRIVYGKKTNIDISSKSFDGWVYADGRTYYASCFEFGWMLPKYFKCENDDKNEKFTIPSISGFVAFNSEVNISGCIGSRSCESSEMKNDSSMMVYVGKGK